MHRFFIGRGQFAPPQITISGSDVVHIRKVLRLKPGDRIEVVDEKGDLYLVQLEQVEVDRVGGKLIEKIRTTAQVFPEITIAQAVPKGDKMDLIVQKTTELGVSRIVPLLSERVIVRLSPDLKARRLARWRKLALESAKQSKRLSVPRVSEFLPLDVFCREKEARDLGIIFWEGETATRLRSLLAGAKRVENIAVIIGPEGGFSNSEVEIARSCGFHPATLGPRILRTETVALSVLSVLQYELGDFG
ncbi:MAG TPA: 16S rRNA (uracil(1498)-N(3))-methyltransferase [bacterium]|nr:16S rRNA (uracil(1498)-N(3))-methyltransferase [bacterium]